MTGRLKEMHFQLLLITGLPVICCRNSSPLKRIWGINMSITDFIQTDHSLGMPGLKPAYFTMGQVVAPDKDTLKGTLRVRVAVMTQGKDVLNSIPFAVPYGGGSYGSFFMPEEGDTVLLFFEGPFFANPVAFGCRFPKEAAIVKENAKEKNPNKVLKVKNGSSLSFTGEKGKEEVALGTSKKLTFTMNEEKEQALLEDSSHKNRLSLQSKEGKLLLEAEKEISLKCGKSSITMDKSGTIKIEGDQVEIAAPKIQLKGKSQVDIQGQAVSVKGKTDVTLNGQTKVTVKSSGQVKVSGAMIQLN